MEREPADAGRRRRAQTRERGLAPPEEIANLAACGAAFLGRQALRGVRQHELVRLFDGIATRGEISHRLVRRLGWRGLLGRRRHVAVITRAASAGAR